MLLLTIVSGTAEYETGAEEYRQIWAEQGENIIRAFKEVTGLDFKQDIIDVIVYEGPSASGDLRHPMKLRASNTYIVKQGALIHELGHRLIAPVHNRLEVLDEHQTLNLFLYDVWCQVFDKTFADKLVEFESNLKGRYDYAATWQWFFTLSPEEKKRLWEEFVSLNQ